MIESRRFYSSNEVHVPFLQTWVWSVFLFKEGYKGAIAVGSAVVTDDRADSVVTGRAAKETFLDNPPGFGD